MNNVAHRERMFPLVFKNGAKGAAERGLDRESIVCWSAALGNIGLYICPDVRYISGLDYNITDEARGPWPRPNIESSLKISGSRDGNSRGPDNTISTMTLPHTTVLLMSF